ncbi:MAG: GxxExxY protein [Bacteroidetes bacterium]|nr:MAG: GxxExxY protein [Bacteroidota bacterium]
MTSEYLYSDLTKIILRAYYNTYNKLGYGFLESVYQNAMMLELKKQGLHCEKETAINVYYDNQIVGSFFADIIVENKVILELKAVSILIPKYEVQLVNYLKGTGLKVGLLLNFGHEPDARRKVWL